MSLVATTGPTSLWYATRGTGVVSLILLTAVVVLGIATSQRLRAARWPRFVVAGLHRNLTLLALAFLAVHIATTVLDGFAPIRWIDAVVPFVSAYRPIWLGFGAVAVDLLLALTITSLLRARIGYRPWRALHWLAYVSWPVALVHAFGTGTDARTSWMVLLAVVCVGTVAAVAVVRVAGAPSPRLRLGGAAAVVLVPLAMFVWYLGGPGRTGWAKRAGTPHALLAPHAAVRRVAAPAPPKLHPAPFTTRFDGTLSESQQQDTGLVLVDIRARTAAPAPGVLWIRLQGEPIEGGGVQMTASGASFGPVGAADQYVGKIAALNGTRMLLDLRNGSRRMSVRVNLQVGSQNHVSGSVAARSGAPA